MKKPTTALAATAALTLAHMAPAGAHHADLSATVGCANASNLVAVTVTATPWVADAAHQVNPEVWIQRRVLGVWQDEATPGAFTLNGFNQIARQVIVDNNTTQLFRARAARPWGPNGEFGNVGTGPEISVRVNAAPCGALTVDPVPTTIDVPKLPPIVTTTTAPTSSSTTSTTIVPVVSSIPPAPIAVPIVSQPRYNG